MPLKRNVAVTNTNHLMLSPDPLNQPAYQAWLQRERQSLIMRMRQKAFRSDDSSLISLTNDMAEAVDEKIADLLRSTGPASLAHEYSELREIDLALQRIGNGTYGTCLECGRTIDSMRLNAWPAARQCMACKESFEKRRGIVGKPAV